MCLLADEYTLSKAMTMAAGSSGAPGATRGRTPRPSPAPPPSAAHDSESDSSGSPCTECNSNPSYRVPINTPKGNEHFQLLVSYIIGLAVVKSPRSELCNTKYIIFAYLQRMHDITSLWFLIISMWMRWFFGTSLKILNSTDIHN